MASIGENITRLREEQHRTKASLATAAGISRQALIAIEQGRTKPTLATVEAIALALNARLDDLITDFAPPPQEDAR